MSSINPVIVLPRAAERRGVVIAGQLADSIVLGCGQFCTNPGLVLGLRSPAFSAFGEVLGSALQGKPAQTMLNAGTLRSYQCGSQHLQDTDGIRLLAEGAADGQAPARLFGADQRLLLEGDEVLQEEVFGPASVLIALDDKAALLRGLEAMQGQLTVTLIGDDEDLEAFAELIPLLEDKAGRLLVNGYPTGVEVADGMVHGGPYPATSDARGTSVGSLAIERWLRPVCYQNFPDSALPDALKRDNPLGITRLVNGRASTAAA